MTYERKHFQNRRVEDGAVYVPVCMCVCECSCATVCGFDFGMNMHEMFCVFTVSGAISDNCVYQKESMEADERKTKRINIVFKLN